MRSIRVRIAFAFAGAFSLALLVFALALLAARRETALRDAVVRAQREAEQTLLIIDRTRSLADAAVQIDEADSMIAPGVSIPLRRFLEILDDYVMVFDADGRELYASRRVRELPIGDRELLATVVRTMNDPALTQTVALRSDDVVVAVRLSRGEEATRIRKLMVAVPVRDALLVPRPFATTMMVIGPLLVLFAIGWSYFVAGQTIRPLERLVEQMKAITDGRSLHRRVAIGSAGSELASVAATLNEMIERLELSFAALRRFTADASHELKTPLAVLRADVERAMSPTATKTERAIALEEALEQVTRMADLVNSLLTLARADEGRLEVVREDVDLAELTREVVDTARLLGEKTQLNIEAPVIEPLVTRGDPMRLRQLFLNLVTNAIKYTAKGGRVRITLLRVGEEAHFNVQDNGIGIAAADLPYVFDRFWRADRSRSRASERGGFGLGLAISQWIAQAHGGALTVQSRLGRGSLFTVQLPLAEPQPNANSALIQS